MKAVYCWYRPGLLCIGDAAHAMSPLGGVGINLALQDAVVAANVLVKPLQTNQLQVRHLRAIMECVSLPPRCVEAVVCSVPAMVQDGLTIRRQECNTENGIALDGKTDLLKCLQAGWSQLPERTR